MKKKCARLAAASSIAFCHATMPGASARKEGPCVSVSVCVCLLHGFLFPFLSSYSFSPSETERSLWVFGCQFHLKTNVEQSPEGQKSKKSSLSLLLSAHILPKGRCERDTVFHSQLPDEETKKKKRKNSIRRLVTCSLPARQLETVNLFLALKTIADWLPVPCP